MGTGIFRRRIYLPGEEYGDRELYYILRHEYAHFLGHDLLIKLIVRLLCCVLWWNPAVYLLRKDVGQLLEIRCDRRASEGFSREERAGYLMTIVQVLRGGSDSGDPDLITGLCYGEDLRERFLCVARPAQPAKFKSRAALWGLSVFLLALSCSFALRAAPGGSVDLSASHVIQLMEWINLGVLCLFLLTQIKYQLFRNKGRSILALSAAALLCGAMAFYMGNIQATQKAIDSLAENIPVYVTVVNRSGTGKTELFIDPQQLDGLSGSGVRDMLVTAEAAGAWGSGARAQEPFFGGDVSMSAINDVRAWEGFDGENMEWQDGAGAEVFGTDRQVCALNAACAERFNAGLGGEVSVAVHAVRRNSQGVTYELLEDAAFEVVGIYHSGDSSVGRDMYISTGWLRAAAGRKGTFFSYDSAVCRLEDPRRLNEFKRELPKLGFLEPFEGAENLYRGDAIAVDDEMFIKTSQNLRRSLATLKSFLAPFCLLIISLVTMLTFLMLRGSRREMAIASSLGQPKWQTALSNFLSTVLAYLAGCAVILPEVVLIAGVPLTMGLAVCGVFILCASMGVALALALILRFDPMELLTRND